MLSVQPKLSNNYGLTFGARNQNNRLTPEEIEEKKYQASRQELLSQKEDFENMIENKNFEFFKPAEKVIKGGAVVTTGLLGGMATGWGTKKTIHAFSKIGQSAPVQGIKKQIKATNTFIKDTFATISKNFKKSEAYKMPLAQINKFEKTKVGAPIVKFAKAVGNGIKAVYNTVKKGIKFIYNKITGVKKETYEKATVNFVGASGGVAAGVTTLKEQSEAGDK